MNKSLGLLDTKESVRAGLVLERELKYADDDRVLRASAKVIEIDPFALFFNDDLKIPE